MSHRLKLWSREEIHEKLSGFKGAFPGGADDAERRNLLGALLGVTLDDFSLADSFETPSKFIAHLQDFTGYVLRVSDQLEVALAGWEQALFLRTWSWYLLCLYQALDSAISERHWALEGELRVAVNAYRVLMGYHPVDSGVNPVAGLDLERWAFELVERIVAEALVKGKFSLPFGTADHAIYVELTYLDSERLLCQVHNVSYDASLQRFHNYVSSGRNKKVAYPFVAACLNLNHASHRAALGDYLSGLARLRRSDACWQSLEEKRVTDSVVEAVYGFTFPEDAKPDNSQQHFLGQLCQTVGNCVYRSYEVGMRLRLPADLVSQASGGRSLIELLLSESLHWAVDARQGDAVPRSYGARLQRSRRESLERFLASVAEDEKFAAEELRLEAQRAALVALKAQMASASVSELERQQMEKWVDFASRLDTDESLRPPSIESLLDDAPGACEAWHPFRALAPGVIRALPNLAKTHPQWYGGMVGYAQSNGGWSIGCAHHRLHFQQGLLERVLMPTLDEKVAEGRVWVQSMRMDELLPGSVQSYSLHPEVVSQLLDGATGCFLPKRNDVGGRHTVLPIELEGCVVYWAKLYPESWPTEYAVGLLMDLILGEQVMPRSVLTKIHLPQGGGTAAVQWTEHVSGESLHKVFKEIPEQLGRISGLSFSQQLLRVLLTNPEDDRDDDYRLVEQGDGTYRLVRLDNERAFYAARGRDKEKKGLTFLSKKKVLLVKTALYSLDHMFQPLSSKVLKLLCSLDAFDVLTSWEEGLKAMHGHLNDLFSEEEAEVHFEREEPGPSIVVMALFEGLGVELLTRLQSIQLVASQYKSMGLAVTGMDLLQAVQPKLAAKYRGAFELYPCDASHPEHAYKRFNYVTGKLWAQGCALDSGERYRASPMTGQRAVTLSLRLSTQLDRAGIVKVRQRVWLSYEQLCKGLLTVAESRARAVGEDLLKEYETRGSREVALTSFRVLPGRLQTQLVKEIGGRFSEDPQRYSLVIQHQFLEALVGVRWHRFDGYPFRAVLDDELLSGIIRGAGAHLVSISLRGCEHINADKVVRQLSSSVSLRELDLREVESLTNIKGPFFQPTLLFSKLVSLDVSGCHYLKEIDIQAKTLTRYWGWDCPQLSRVRTGQEWIDKVASGLYTLSQFLTLAQTQKELGSLSLVASAAGQLEDSSLLVEAWQVAQAQVKRLDSYRLGEVLVAVTEAAYKYKNSSLLVEVLRVVGSERRRLGRDDLDWALAAVVEFAGKHKDSSLLVEVLRVDDAQVARLNAHQPNRFGRRKYAQVLGYDDLGGVLVAVVEFVNKHRDSLLLVEVWQAAKARSMLLSSYDLCPILVTVAKAAGEFKNSSLLAEVWQVAKVEDQVEQLDPDSLGLMLDLVAWAAGQLQNSEILHEVWQVTQDQEKRLGDEFVRVLVAVGKAAGEFKNSSLLVKVWQVAKVEDQVEQLDPDSLRLMLDLVAWAAGQLQNSEILREVWQVTQDQEKRLGDKFVRVLVAVASAAGKLEDSSLLAEVWQVAQWLNQAAGLVGDKFVLVLVTVALAAGKLKDPSLLFEVWPMVKAQAERLNQMHQNGQSLLGKMLVAMALAAAGKLKDSSLLAEVWQVAKAEDLAEQLDPDGLGMVAWAAGQLQNSEVLREVWQVTQDQEKRLGDKFVRVLVAVASAAGKLKAPSLLFEVWQVAKAEDLAEQLDPDGLGMVALAAGQLQNSEILREVWQVTQDQEKRLGDKFVRVLVAVALVASDLKAPSLLFEVWPMVKAQAARLNQMHQNGQSLLGKILVAVALAAGRLENLSLLFEVWQVVKVQAEWLGDDNFKWVLFEVLQVVKAQVGWLDGYLLSEVLISLAEAASKHKDSLLLFEVWKVEQAQAMQLGYEFGGVLVVVVEFADKHKDSSLLVKVLQVVKKVQVAHSGRFWLTQVLIEVASAAGKFKDLSLLFEVLHVAKAQAKRLGSYRLNQVLVAVASVAGKLKDSSLLFELLQMATQVEWLDSADLGKVLVAVASVAGKHEDSLLLDKVWGVVKAQTERLGDKFGEVLVAVARAAQLMYNLALLKEALAIQGGAKVLGAIVNSLSPRSFLRTNSAASFFGRSSEEEKGVNELSRDDGLSHALQLSEIEGEIFVLERQRVILLQANQKTPSRDTEKRIEDLDAQLARLQAQAGGEDSSRRPVKPTG